MKSGAIWMELHALHKHGWSISALAREFGLNWRTVQRELARPRPRHYPAPPQPHVLAHTPAPPHSPERPKPTPLTEAQLRQIERRLGVCPTVRGTDLHAELCREYGYT